MTPTSNIHTATATVVWGGLALGVILGLVGQISRFCVRGAIADWCEFGGRARLMSWILAVAIAAAGIQVVASLGLFDPARAVAWNTRFQWLSYIVGGVLFGYGMVLCGGCPQRSLVKTGEGNLRALVVLVVTALVALMTVKGVFAEARVGVLDRFSIVLSVPQDLGSLASTLVPVPAQGLRWLLVAAVLLGAGALAWRHRSEMQRMHWLGGIVVGLLVPAAFLLTGYVGFVAEHPETLEPAWLGTATRRPEGLSFSGPLANTVDLLTLWSDKSMVATFGVMLTAGVLLGAFTSAKARGTFKLEAFASPRDLLLHLAGAVLMGFGGVTAVGCSVGQGVTGLAMLSAGAVLAVAGISLGAVLALRTQRPRQDTVNASRPAAA